MLFLAALTSAQIQDAYKIKDTIILEIEVYPDDIANSGYVIEWNNPFIFDSNTVVRNPKYEFHCYVKDKNGIAGSYSGSSSSFTYCNFKTLDSIIEIVFIKRPNLNALNDSLADNINWMHGYTEFKSIKLNLKQLTNTKIILKPKEGLPDNVVIKNNCSRSKVVIVSRFSKKREEFYVKTGRLLKLKLETGDIVNLKSGNLNYTHFQGQNTNIYLCSNEISR